MVPLPLEGPVPIGEQTRKHLTHQGYLRAFATIITSRYCGPRLPTMRNLLSGLDEATRAMTGYKKLQRRQGTLSPAVRSLENAWGTELLLALQDQYLTGDEMVRIANSWAAVQAYYVVYHATQALQMAKAVLPTMTHPKTQRQFLTNWSGHDNALAPWCLVATKTGGTRGVPTGLLIDQAISAWIRPDAETCWSVAIKALRTTRESKITNEWDLAREAKLAERRVAGTVPPSGQVRLSAAAKSKLADRVDDAGLIHYLYRLRTRANYENAALFIEGPSTPADADELRRHMRIIVATTLLVHELYIARLVGVEALTQRVDEWISRNHPPGVRLGIALRRDLIAHP